MRSMRVWILVALAAGTAACGQKGPLVLPDAQHPHKKVRFPVTPRPTATSPATPAAPSTPAAPARDPSAPAGPAPPEAAPETNSTPDPAPQA